MSSAADPHPFWSHDPLALVVNLDDRPQRWTETLAAASGHLPVERLARHSAVRGSALPGYGAPPWFRDRPRDRTWAGRAGCLLSHRRAIERAAAEGREWLLVLEDDVAFEPAFDAVLRALAPRLETHPGWVACYLGFADPVGPFQTVGELVPGVALHRIGGANHTHAYLLHRRAFAPVLKRWPDTDDIWPWLARHRAVDRWYRRHLADHGEVLAVSPSVANQRAGLSDITGRDTGSPQELAPVTSVGPDSPCYRLARGLRPPRIALADAWDAVRARRKHRRGF